MARMNEAMLDRVAKQFRTLGEPFRLRILQSLESGEKSVSDLVHELDGNQPNVSKHLQILFDAELVSRRREGTTILYAIGYPMVFKLCELVCHNEVSRSRRDFEALKDNAPAKRKR